MVKRKKILMIGAGGLTNASFPLLLQSEIEQITIVDEDHVEKSNLHRQLLFSEKDLNKKKVSVLANHPKFSSIATEKSIRIIPKIENFNPGNAQRLIRDHDLVVEGSDNYPTKFLTADVCYLENKPVIFAGCTGWNGWALVTIPNHTPCLRCVFEEIPAQEGRTCNEAGVLGPIVGVLGTLQANFALQGYCNTRKLENFANPPFLWSYQGLTGRLRGINLKRRADCMLCGTKQIRELRLENYLPTASLEL